MITYNDVHFELLKREYPNIKSVKKEYYETLFNFYGPISLDHILKILKELPKDTEFYIQKHTGSIMIKKEKYLSDKNSLYEYLQKIDLDKNNDLDDLANEIMESVDFKEVIDEYLL